MASSGWQGEVTLQSGGFGYDYFKGDFRVDSITHSGGTVTVTGAFGVRNTSGYSAYYVYAINAAANGYTNYQQVVAPGQWISGGSEVTSNVSFSFSAAASSTSANIEVLWNYNNGTASNSKVYTLYFDASIVRPDQPTVTITERYTDGAKFNVSLNSYGVPSDNPNRYIEAAILGQDNLYGNPYKYATATARNSASITVNNSNNGNLSIKSNTKYWYGGYATNTADNNSIITGSFYTLPTAPVGSNFNQDSDTTASFQISETSAGQGRTIQLQYRYKKHSNSTYSAWTNAGSTGNFQTETVTLTGLTSGDYDVQVRSKTSASDYSAVNTYENAFSFLMPSITITDVQYQYADTNNCRATFSYVISSIDSTASHRIETVATASTSQTYSTTFSNKPITGTFTTTVPVDETFEMLVTLDSGVATTTYGFTTPSLHPTFQLRAAQKTDTGMSGVSISAYMDFGFGSEFPAPPLREQGQVPNTYSVYSQSYDPVTDTWGSGYYVQNNTQVSERSASFSTTSLFKPGYPVRTKIKWIFIMQNGRTHETVNKTVIFEAPYNISGKIITEDGTILNIIGTIIKDKNGNITSRYSSPVKIIK